MTPFAGTNRVTSAFGYREYTYNGKLIKEQHKGQDMVPTKYPGEGVAESAWNVREVTGGRVLRVASDSARGNYVDIETAPGVFERYQHMKSIAVRVGQAVAQGALVGVAGNTGQSTARHLHFGVYKGGTAESCAINPSQWSGLPNAAGSYPGNDDLDGVGLDATGGAVGETATGGDCGCCGGSGGCGSDCGDAGGAARLAEAVLVLAQARRQLAAAVDAVEKAVEAVGG